MIPYVGFFADLQCAWDANGDLAEIPDPSEDIREKMRDAACKRCIGMSFMQEAPAASA